MLTYKSIDFASALPQVLALTKAHLDEDFNETFFKWKHLENPFGVSFAMGAWDSDKLVGLRLFMRWEFVGPNATIVKAIRPVDTVTHTDYRGKGIFKTLTLKGLELNQNNYDLIFNTPNQNSLPGYLKMGWQKIALPNNFIYALLNPFIKNKNKVVFSFDRNDLPKINNQFWQTHTNESYVKWRYQDAAFLFATFPNAGFVVYKMTMTKGIRTIMVYETIGKSDAIASILAAIASKEKTFLCYGYFGDATADLPFLICFKRNKPVVVWRDDTFGIHDSMNFSLGDLEGKL